jgi:hypothetical protein
MPLLGNKRAFACPESSAPTRNHNAQHKVEGESADRRARVVIHVYHNAGSFVRTFPFSFYLPTCLSAVRRSERISAVREPQVFLWASAR